MREILFRGKRLCNGMWVEGGFHSRFDRAFIIGISQSLRFDGVEVDPATVGQYTGLKDKTGKRIFEGDILEQRIRTRPGRDGSPRWRTRKYIVRWGNGGFHLDAIGAKGRPASLCTWMPVIGNIHDNPELLGGGEA